MNNKQPNNNRQSLNFINYIKTNKIQSLFVAFLITSLTFYIQPEHIKNPKVLARNRLIAKQE